VFAALSRRILTTAALMATHSVAAEVLLAGAAGFTGGALYGFGHSLLNPLSAALGLGAHGCSAVNAAAVAVLGRADGLLKVLRLQR
jgi:hypothetical protein